MVVGACVCVCVWGGGGGGGAFHTQYEVPTRNCCVHQNARAKRRQESVPTIPPMRFNQNRAGFRASTRGARY